MFKYVTNNVLKDIKLMMKEKNTGNGQHYSGIWVWGILYFVFCPPFVYRVYEANVIKKPLIFYLSIPIIAVLILFIYEFIGYLKNKRYKCEHDYYRELPRDYSPSLVSYLMNFKTEFKKDVMADVLFLEQKGILIIENNKIKILEKFDTFKEKHLEFLVNDVIIDGMSIDKLLNIHKDIQKTYEKKIRDDLIVLGLIKWPKKNQVIEVVCALIGGVSSSLIRCIPNTISSDSKFVLKWLFILFFIMFIGSMIVISVYTCKVSLTRTKEGKKDVGLWFSYAQFLKHFSLMDERNFEEKVLWGYYFAYGLALGINKKVINKFKLENEKNMI